MTLSRKVFTDVISNVNVIQKLRWQPFYFLFYVFIYLFLTHPGHMGAAGNLSPLMQI